jgi:phage N-6-adenine-methyltransferase
VADGTGPSVKRHRSKQDYETPAEFIAACVKRFGLITFDLAATAANAKAPRHFDLEQDSLRQDWREKSGTLWLNPPFADIRPWAAKCSGARNRTDWILLLTPGSIGTDWFAEHVQGKAIVLGLSPRITFVGSDDPYPKDLILSCFGFGVHGFDTWRWDR